MGWKNIKVKFQITHQVYIGDGLIRIRSPYTDLATINTKTGVLYQNKSFAGFLQDYYPNLLKASPQELLDLIRSPDEFSQSIKVYTYFEGEIIEKHCESLGWPNVTHDGCLMYENKFSAKKSLILQWTMDDINAETQLYRESIAHLERELATKKGQLTLLEQQLNNLNQHSKDMVQV